MAKRRVARLPKQLTVYDKEKYFDAKFTANEREQLREKIFDVVGEDDAFRRFCFFRSVENEVIKFMGSMGWGKYEQLQDFVLIKVCRDLEIEYKSFAKNEPKLPIAGFIELSKRTFTDFRAARNSTTRTLQGNKLWSLFCDWRDRECHRTGCKREDHWLCRDRFERPDLEAIAASIADNNATRSQMLDDALISKNDSRIRLVYSRA